MSSLPTSALSRYVLVGQGECQGSEPNSRYGEITISSDSADENVCAALCNECVFGQFPGGEFRGFQFRTGRQDCTCLVDGSAISDYDCNECSSLLTLEYAFLLQLVQSLALMGMVSATRSKQNKFISKFTICQCQEEGKSSFELEFSECLAQKIRFCVWM